MPRKAKPTNAIAEQQPRLFDFPEEPHLVELVKSYRHTGATALKDEPRAMMAVELMLAGVGLDRVAERVRAEFGTGFGVHTLRAIRDELEAGNLAGWKERITAKSKRLAERLVDSISDDLDTGALEPGQKPITLGILADKIAGWDGQAGLVVEHRIAPVLNVDAVNQLLSRAPEIHSGEQAQIPAPIDVATVPGPCSGPCPVPVPTGPAAVEGGGGDRVSTPGRADADASASGEFPPNVSLPATGSLKHEEESRHG